MLIEVQMFNYFRQPCFCQADVRRFVVFVYIFQLYFRSNSTIHSIPYLSLKQPKYEPQGLSPIGPSICPATESPLNNLSASSLLSAIITILLLFSFSFVFPILSGTSFAINILLLPIGKAICIILFSSFFATGNSGLARSLKRITFANSPPNTDL